MEKNPQPELLTFPDVCLAIPGLLQMGKKYKSPVNGWMIFKVVVESLIKMVTVIIPDVMTGQI